MINTMKWMEVWIFSKKGLWYPNPIFSKSLIKLKRAIYFSTEISKYSFCIFQRIAGEWERVNSLSIVEDRQQVERF